jgi:pimeloyl-ACP methyl ester carboxylesterase
MLACGAALAAPTGSTAAKPGATPAPGKTPARRPGGLTFEPYTITLLSGQTRDAELGRLYVPESRDRDTTHLIRLAFLRWKSTSPKPGSPILFLAGGPGIPGSAVARVPAYAQLFERLRAEGDVIVPDQRGTGLCEPSLTCATATPPTGLFESEAAMRQGILSEIRPCASKLREEGIAIEAYNTKESAGDVEDLRRALGAERVRLVAASYGTELALETIRLHGSRIERAVLAGVRGPDQALKLPGVLDLQLRRISAMVAKDSSYASKPNCETLARALLDALDERPLSLSSSAPGGGKQTMKIAGAGLAAVLQGDLTDGRAVVAVPAMLNAMAAGDFQLFLGRLQTLYNTMALGISAMSISVSCASGAYPDRREQVGREAGASPFGNIRNLYVDSSLCSAVGSRDLGSSYRSRLYSPVPVLFLSGSLDATTPSFEAEEVAWGFPSGVHLVVQNGFHETLPEEQVQKLVVDYLDGVDVKGRRVAAPPPHFLSMDEARKMFQEQIQRPR